MGMFDIATDWLKKKAASVVTDIFKPKEVKKELRSPTTSNGYSRMFAPRKADASKTKVETALSKLDSVVSTVSKSIDKAIVTPKERKNAAVQVKKDELAKVRGTVQMAKQEIKKQLNSRELGPVALTMNQGRVMDSDIQKWLTSVSKEWFEIPGEKANALGIQAKDYLSSYSGDPGLRYTGTDFLNTDAYITPIQLFIHHEDVSVGYYNDNARDSDSPWEPYIKEMYTRLDTSTTEDVCTLDEFRTYFETAIEALARYYSLHSIKAGMNIGAQNHPQLREAIENYFGFTDLSKRADIDGYLDRWAEIVKTYVHLPHDLMNYLEWRYNHFYKTINSKTAAISMYDYGSDTDKFLKDTIFTSLASGQNAIISLEMKKFWNSPTTKQLKVATTIDYDVKEKSQRMNYHNPTKAKSRIVIEKGLTSPADIIGSVVSTQLYDSSLVQFPGLFRAVSQRAIRFLADGTYNMTALFQQVVFDLTTPVDAAMHTAIALAGAINASGYGAAEAVFTTAAGDINLTPPVGEHKWVSFDEMRILHQRAARALMWTP